MTKRLFAGLLIVQGILGVVVSIAWGYHASKYSYHLAIPSTLISCAEIWIGVGLLRNSPLARWLALGAGTTMIIGGVVVPIITVLAAGYLELFLAAFGFGRTPDWVHSARWLAVLVVVYAIAAAIIAFKGFHYLRSYEGRMEFGGSDEAPGILRDEQFGVVVASTITWLLASWLSTKDVTIMASSVPRFLMTAEMKRAAEEKDAKDRASITSGAMFSLDSKHIVFPPSALSPGVKVLDIESGRLRRTKVERVPIDREFYQSIAPDGSSLVIYGKWYSLIKDESRAVNSLATEHLGFHSPTTMLQYDSRNQKLELVDLERDERLYSLPVSLSQRGEPSSDKPYNWSDFSQRWSADRRRYAWMNRDNTLSVLDVDSGNLRNVRCRYCSYGAGFSFTYSGNQIFVPESTSRGDDSPQAALGGLLEIATEQWTSVSYRGDVEHVAPDGSAAAFVRYQANAFDYQSLGSQGSQLWTLKMPDEFGPVRTSGNGKFLYTFRKGEHSGATLMYALFEPPEDRARVKFLKIGSSLDDFLGDRWSPDWRYLLRVAGPKIELIALDPAMWGHNTVRTMDVLEDSQLSEAQIAPSNPGVTESWEEDLSRREEIPQAASDFLDLSREPSQAVAQPEVLQAEAPAPAVGGIVKCVDTSGSVTFTQGACPAGMRRAEAPVIDSAPSQPYAARAATRGAEGTARGEPTLSSIMKPGDKMENLQMHTAPCPGRPQHKATYAEATIRRASGGVDVVFAAGANGRHVFPNARSALEGACALL
jgi:hypothetical protein